MPRYKKGIWSGRNQKILEYYHRGMKQVDIAAKVGLSAVHVSTIINSDEFCKRNAEFEKTIQDKVMEVFVKDAIAAANKIVRLSKEGSTKQKTQFEAAKEVLYQVGCKPKTVVEETIKKEYTPEEVAQALKTMMEVEAISNRLVDKPSRFVIDNIKKDGNEGAKTAG